MKKLLCYALIAFAALPVFAQTVIYDANAELRQAKNFTAIEVSHGIEVFISQGEEAIAVSASEIRYRDRIKVTVEKGVLKLWYDESNRISVNAKRNLKAYISYKNLDAISASGGSEVVIERTLKSKSFSIHISGGSDFTGKVEVEQLNINQSGGSDVGISGRAKTVSINTSGGSDFNGYDLTTEVCEVEASGGSDVEVMVNKEISAKASGASDISFKGNATVKKSKSSGASSVSKKS